MKKTKFFFAPRKGSGDVPMNAHMSVSKRNPKKDLCMCPKQFLKTAISDLLVYNGLYMIWVRPIVLLHPHLLLSQMEKQWF